MPSRSSIRLSVIIPAFNEELRLPKTLKESIEYLKSRSYASEIIIVDDGSADGTERVAREPDYHGVSLTVLKHPDRRNHGKGASVRLGMSAARGSYFLFMDADNSTTLNQVERFWPLFDQGYDLVIGSRAMKESVIGVRQSRHKEIAGRWGNWLIQKLAVPGIRDTQAGFKMVAAEKAAIIVPRMTIDRWGYDIEMLAIARLHGCRVAEIPITWINAEGSKVTLRAYLDVLREVWKIRKNLKAGLYR